MISQAIRNTKSDGSAGNSAPTLTLLVADDMMSLSRRNTWHLLRKSTTHGDFQARFFFLRDPLMFEVPRQVDYVDWQDDCWFQTFGLVCSSSSKYNPPCLDY